MGISDTKVKRTFDKKFGYLMGNDSLTCPLYHIIGYVSIDE